MRSAFLFPGQGSQSVGMADSIFNTYAIAQETLNEADQALDEKLSGLIQNGPAETLKETANAQPAILTVSVAIGRVLQEKGLQAVVMAGHSLGEYSALVLSGALGFPDAVRLVRLRGRFMQEAVPLGEGTMSAILGAEDALVEEVCSEITRSGDLVEPANYNCPGQLVISGTVLGVAKAVEELKKRGAKRCIPLEVSAPFHSSLLKPAAEKLRPELEKVIWNDPRTPYVANVDCATVTSKNQIIQRLTDQIWKPVRWTQTLQKIFNEWKPDRSIEVGPGQVVSGHVKKINMLIQRITSDSLESVELLQSIKLNQFP